MHKRYYGLDLIRGLTFFSMVLYHALWDLVVLYDKKINWYTSAPGYVWQQSICFTFTILSGFCWSFGHSKWKRSLLLLAAGGLITLVTTLFVPEGKIVFGILTFLGAAALCLNLTEKLLRKCPAGFGMILSVLLFMVTRNVNTGTLGYESLHFLMVPRGFYRNWLTTFLGFPGAGFVSADYFSLIPWLFLYLFGYFLYRFSEGKGKLFGILEKSRCKFFEKTGRLTLVLYLLHQPLLYGVFCLIPGL